MSTQENLHQDLIDLIEFDKRKKQSIDKLFDSIVKVVEQTRLEEHHNWKDLFDVKNHHIATSISAFKHMIDQTEKVQSDLVRINQTSQLEFLKMFNKQNIDNKISQI